MVYYFCLLFCVKAVKFVKTLVVILVLFRQIYSRAILYTFNSKRFSSASFLLVSKPTFYGFDFVGEVYPCYLH